MSMQQPFKFRHLDSIVGAFVLSSVAIVIVALALIGSAKQWFTSKSEIEAQTPLQDASQAVFLEDLAESLKPGTPVEFSGQVVGNVLLSERENGRLRLRLKISDQTLRKLHQGDAKALIKVPIAPFMGQPRVVLKAGASGELGWSKEQTLPIDPPRDSTAMAMHVLRDLEANLDPMMKAITGLVTESRNLVAEIREQRLPQQAGELVAGLRARQVPQRLDGLLSRIEAIATTAGAIAITAEATAADAKRITGGLVEGKGIAGKALSDAQLGDDLAKLANDLRVITAELRKAAPTIPALAEGSGTLLDEVQRLVDGINRHWLLRSYTDPGTGERIVPPGIIAAPEAKP